MYTNLKRKKRGFTPSPNFTIAKQVIDKLSTKIRFRGDFFKARKQSTASPRLHAKVSMGFTLIELLVVIGIIGLLTAVMTVSFTEVRKQSRDKSRMVDLKQLELAMELYREANGRYPARGCNVTAGWVTPGLVGGSINSCDEYALDLAPDYIPTLPTDPKSENLNNKGIFYTVNTTGTEYKLMFHRTVESLFVTDNDNEFSRFTDLCTYTEQPDTYAIYHDTSPGDSSGPECW